MTSQGLALHDSPQSVQQALIAQPQATAPVVILIHGYKFAPHDPAHCPHDHILSTETTTPCPRALSWPRALGLSTAPTLGIAFGWPARGSIWSAYTRAAKAGEHLAQLIAMIRQTQPNRPIHLMAHSLGARVALSALPHLPAHSVQRILLLAGAERTQSAAQKLATPAGRSAQIIAVTSRENTAYDLLFATLMGSNAINRTPPTAPNWTRLPIDQPQTLAALNTHSFPIAPPQSRICHWSSYLRPGVFTLYKALITHNRPLPIATLRAILPTPGTTQPEGAPSFTPQLP